MKTFINFEITNKELSLKLKTAGLRADRSLFYYTDRQLLPVSCKEADTSVDIPTFTTAQLGALLPDTITKNDKVYTITVLRSAATISYLGKELQTVTGETEVEVRAKMLLLLLEATLLDYEDINKQLNEFGYDYIVPF